MKAMQFVNIAEGQIILFIYLFIFTTVGMLHSCKHIDSEMQLIAQYSGVVFAGAFMM